MDPIDIALLVIVIAMFALIPIGCIMTRKRETPPATRRNHPQLASISALLSSGHAAEVLSNREQLGAQANPDWPRRAA
jgi:disulfide bond formation protein DsbB